MGTGFRPGPEGRGIVTAGADVRDAVIRAVLLEKAAHQQMLTPAFGGPVHWSPDDEPLRKRATVWGEYHLVMLRDLLTRTLDRDPSGSPAT